MVLFYNQNVHVQKFLQVSTSNPTTEFHIPKGQDPGPEASEKIPAVSVEAFEVLLLKIPKSNNFLKSIMKLYLFAINSMI